METSASFKGYGRVDELEEAAFKRKTRKQKIILSISLVLFLLLIIGVVAGTLFHRKNSSNADDVPAAAIYPAEAINSLCSVTLYPESCSTSLDASNTTDPEKIFQFSLTVAMNSLQRISSTFPEKFNDRAKEPAVKQALEVCGSVLHDAVDSLGDCISYLDGKPISVSKLRDLKTWLSTAITDQETCFDALQEVNAAFVTEVKHLMKNSTEFASNSLAIVSKFLQTVEENTIPIHRRLLEAMHGSPSWLTTDRRRFLQEYKPKPNVTVANDGSGDVRTITEAVARIQNKSERIFVIYVKAGEYVENVVLSKSLWNVMIYGDGKAATVVSGRRSNGTGFATFVTATFVAMGKGFMARDISFRNDAGPQNNQAVAFRSGSDRSIFYRCSFEAFQDTLYAYSNRQFYRECDVAGTVDFIFGNSASVFQNCRILPRQPLPNQFVTITAQGKTDPNQNTGISIQRSIISPLDNLTAPTFLGRPWKNYSTTVVLQTNIGGFLNPLGWLSWQSSDPPSTIFYGEYANVGPGSNTSSRVRWVGYRPSLTAPQASKFDVENFIQGTSWLNGTNVAFDST
ncbi:pectinesterase 3 [Dorcoceras hygrometricum]|uniref:Pectinesterase n=1 Tax=Dorcoceras hygrometricum TaxID=472368 RepID=A0A2Z7CA75_9LAMI|nr:pectinesterase 3 [Dorcoceras hygrometricum]